MPEKNITYHYELRRAIASGILETAGSTFLLLIAVKALYAESTAKALVAAGGSMGLIVSLWVVIAVEKLGMRTSQAASRCLLLGSASFLVSAIFPILPVFVFCSILGMTAGSAVIPLLTQIYQENYPEKDRGSKFSRTVMIRVGVAVVFSYFAGIYLSRSMNEFKWLLVIFAGAMAFSSYCLSRCPSRPLVESSGLHPFRAFRFIKEDRSFRWTLVCWMLVGIANLMMLPLRVEYMANPKYGLELTAEKIAMYTAVIPNIARLIMSPLWGWLFDRMNFFIMRIILNTGFAIGFLSFFATNSTPGMIFGAIVFGISNAGGDVAWSLWVTKLAPPRHVADYMSVHTFLTGVRGVFAPFIAFYFIADHSIASLGIISAVLVFVGSAILVPEIKSARRARPAAPAVPEEIPE